MGLGGGVAGGVAVWGWQQGALPGLTHSSTHAAGLSATLHRSPTLHLLTGRYAMHVGGKLAPPLGGAERLEGWAGLVPTDVRVEGGSWKESSTDVAIAGGSEWFRWGGRVERQATEEGGRCSLGSGLTRCHAAWPAPPLLRCRPGMGGRRRGRRRGAAGVGAAGGGGDHPRCPGTGLCPGSGASRLWPGAHRCRQEPVRRGPGLYERARGCRRQQCTASPAPLTPCQPCPLLARPSLSCRREEEAKQYKAGKAAESKAAKKRERESKKGGKGSRSSADATAAAAGDEP